MPTQDCDLVPERQDLRILRRARPMTEAERRVFKKKAQ
jgi:hypothetical protein